MNPCTLELLNKAGWYDPIHSGGEQWIYLLPAHGNAMPAPDLLNLLRLGGYNARPNRTNPTRIYLHRDEPPSP